MARDLKLISHWRKLARSTRLTAGRRIQLIDNLASHDNIYRLDGDSDEFVPTPIFAVKIVTRLLNKLMRENKTRDRVRSRIIDRVSFMRGQKVEGFFRVPDPSQVKAPVQTTLSTEQLLQKVAVIVKGGKDGITNETEQANSI